MKELRSENKNHVSYLDVLSINDTQHDGIYAILVQVTKIFGGEEIGCSRNHHFGHPEARFFPLELCLVLKKM